MTTPLEIFYSYSHRDEGFKNQLETHLALLRRKGFVNTWHDRQINPGQEWTTSIDNHLNEADVILLLISADFMASDYCYGKELARAMEQHERGDATVVPVILRAVDWADAPFARLQVLPTDGVPVASWKNEDEAWLNVETGIRKIIENIRETKYRRTFTQTLTSIQDVIVNELKQIDKAYSHNCFWSKECFL